MFKTKTLLTNICLTSIFLLLTATPKVNAEKNNFNEEIQKSSTTLIAQRRSSRIRFKLPKRGVPGGTIGGATRSGSNSVSAIIPKSKLGLTASESPMIFVYIPKNQSQTANLILVDQEGEEVYKGSFTVPETSGIIRIKLPQTVELQSEKAYRWQVSLTPPNSNPMLASKLRTFGWIEKVSLENTANQQEVWSNIDNLAQAGIWHDTLQELTVLRLESPEDQEIETEWNELLDSVGLKSFASTNVFPEIIEVN